MSISGIVLICLLCKIVLVGLAIFVLRSLL